MTTGLTSIEQHAASVYTREVFTDVKKQIVQAAALILISKKRCLNTMVYMVEEYEQPATRIKVAYGRSTGKIDCQCNFWRKNGYPCRHMFFVMKSEHVTTIPDALVLQRWRLNAKAIESYVERWGGTSEAGFLLRHDEFLGEYEDVATLDVDDIKRMRWDSVDAAYEFYRRLGMCHGFGVRKGDSGKDCRGNLIRYRFFCNKEGLRDGRHNDRVDRRRAHKPETRTNCEAKLSIYFDKIERCWKVRKVATEHNHDLTPASMVHLIANHREMTDAAKAQIDGLHASGIATSKIVGYMAGMAGGYSLLGFLKKDVYNYADRTRRANISDGDANAAVVYLEGKAGSDPMSVARYSVTKDARLANLIWADGASRVDYQHFGDVLAFDSTYKKNNSFRRWLYVDMEIEEFEMEWERAVAEYDLYDKEWATQMYERRMMWANAYLQGKFCAGFRTTSRCEGVNAFVKKFSKTTHTILELVQNLELVVREYRNKDYYSTSTQ
ncbi:protein FAR1-RELATED SEQUENCE 5-like [Arachis duranensis]|uniref:Protein FAR1-RELATED SEQUENCE 5-like n=1 Tax=Arachis duranensis TaxID=130453 RepID=A0A6P5N7F6_ARADU|nr:protein FAR1-RELATED SEQUENCE 5-like [Arachis duranensis]